MWNLSLRSIRPGISQKNATIKMYSSNKLLKALRICDSTFYRLGREPSLCDYTCEHPSISRIHACIVNGPDGSVYVINT